ncbi:MAG: hypothetical protein GX657_11520 [Chloroflexi bacterium]|nr:hypothetical protein [Chloroflexota bacterium]
MEKCTHDTQLDAVIEATRLRYGQRALFRGGGGRAGWGPVLPTGFPDVDRLLGIGGLPQGRMTELVGAGTSGRGTLVARTLALEQRAAHQVVYVDVTQAIDLDMLSHSEVCFDSLAILRPLNFGHALEMTHDLIVEGGAGVILFDRLDNQYEGPAQPDYGLLDRSLREWNTLLSRSLCALIFLTEVTSLAAYPVELTLPYFASVRLGFEWQSWLWPYRRLTGFHTRITVLKNKMASTEGQSLLVHMPVFEG